MSQPINPTDLAEPPYIGKIPPTAPGSSQDGAGLARSAAILGAGNVASRVIGLARDTIKSYYFGSSGALSAFTVASNVPTMVYDLLVGGMLSAALVPVFTTYADPDRREELAVVAGSVLTLIAFVMGAIVVLLELLAGPVAGLLGQFADPALQAVLVQSLRLITPAIFLFGLSGGVTGLLYALKRFSYVAAGGAVFNLGLVLAVPLLAGTVGVQALPIGIVAGGLVQLLVMLSGLRGVRLRLVASWRHPAVRRILSLYVPIALGLVVTQFQIVVDRRWASATGAQSVSWMQYATTLVQLPLGLVPVAVSLAALPSLAGRAAAADWEAFRRLVGRGLRLVLVLLVPAAVGLAVLAEPVIRLLFEHGSFTVSDTGMTALALRLYLIGLLFAGVDFMLNYTFYARQDTRTPAIVGVIATGAYFAFALALLPRLGFLGLVLADSAKQACHAAIMIVLLGRSAGHVRGQRVGATTGRAIFAAGCMAPAVFWLARLLQAAMAPGFVAELAVVVTAAAAGAGLYSWVLRLLGVEEISEIAALVGRRLGTPFARILLRIGRWPSSGL